MRRVRPLNDLMLIDIVAIQTPLKLRLAINQFIVAYGRETFVALCVTTHRSRGDVISIRVHDQNWGRILTDRECPTFERALELGERFFDTQRDAWVLAPREVEAWREPVAKEFESRRDVLLDRLRSALATDVGYL